MFSVEACDNNKKKWFLFKDRTGLKRIPAGDILYLEISGRKTAIHTETEIILCNEKLFEISHKLDGDQFIQCHQSYVVNLQYVFEIHKCQLVLLNKEIIPLSRKHWEKVKNAFIVNFSD
jgi:DNA-binding LytR/AlgR family response regulator